MALSSEEEHLHDMQRVEISTFSAPTKTGGMNSLRICGGIAENIGCEEVFLQLRSIVAARFRFLSKRFALNGHRGGFVTLKKVNGVS